jgi:hypothetical protein
MQRPTILTAAVVLAAVTIAQGLGAQASPPTFGCPAPEHKQFAFWVGDWNVTVQGNQAGTNRVTLEESGCVIHEHWTGARGGTGQSFNFYDRTIGKWHQFWVDNQGHYLHLKGRYRDDRLILEGTGARSGGKPERHRLTFIRNADGSVRQLWETSGDGGGSWRVAFDGLYRRR